MGRKYHPGEGQPDPTMGSKLGKGMFLDENTWKPITEWTENNALPPDSNKLCENGYPLYFYKINEYLFKKNDFESLGKSARTFREAINEYKFKPNLYWGEDRDKIKDKADLFTELITCLVFFHAVDDNMKNLYHNIGVILITAGHLNIFDAYVEFHDMESPYHQALYDLHKEVLKSAEVIKGRGSAKDGTLDMYEKEAIVIYFYEHFLDCYDKQARQDLGIWYTPESIYRFINSSIRWLVNHHFPGKHAEYFDFATGTGTFMLDMIRREYEASKNKYDKKTLKWHLFNCVTAVELNDMSYILCVYNLYKLVYTLVNEWTGEIPIIDPDRPTMLTVYNNNTLVTGGNPPLFSTNYSDDIGLTKRKKVR